MTAAKKDILQGWKDIAAYVSRDVRTVKRWEKQRGLPVRRMPGEGRANVYALIPELDNWLSAGGPVEAEHEDNAEAQEVVAAFTTVEEVSLQPPNTRRRWIFAAVGLICVSAIAAFGYGIRVHRREQAAADIPPFNPTQTVRMVRYMSKVNGVDALYLRGIYFYEKRTPDTLARALKCFQDAISKDPGYAPAYAGLAQTYNLLREFSMMPNVEAYEKAKTAAQRAISLDPKLPEAHAALGFVEFFHDWNPAAAEQEFRTSIALDPDSALVHHWYGSMLTHEGRFEESLVQLDLAQHLQPTSTSIMSDRAFALGLSGHRDEAVDTLQGAISDDTQSPEPHFIIAVLSVVEPRDIPRYLDELRRFANLRRDTHKLKELDVIEPAFRSGGANALWRALLDEERRQHPRPGDATLQMAEAEALLGLDDDSLRDLKQLANHHDPDIIGIAIDPFLTRLHKDPRYLAAVATVGVPAPQ